MAISPAVIAEPDRLGLRRTSFKEKVTMGIAPNRLARSAGAHLVQIPRPRPVPTYFLRRLGVPTSPRAQRSFDSTAPPAAIETSTKPPGFQQHPRWKRRRGACRESPTARGSTPPDV